MKTDAYKMASHSWLMVWVLLALSVFISTSLGCDTKTQATAPSLEPQLKASITDSIVPLFGRTPLPPSPSGIINLAAGNSIRRLYDQANSSYAAFRYVQATNELSQALKAYKELKPDDKLGIALLYERLGAFSLSLDLTNNIGPTKADIALNQALSLLSNIPNSDAEQARCYFFLGRDRSNRLLRDEAISYFNKQIDIVKKLEGVSSKSLPLTYSLIAYQYFFSAPELALQQLAEALKIVQSQMGINHPDVARVYLDIGFAKSQQNDTAEALKYYQQALKIFDNSLGYNSDESAEAHFRIAGLYNKEASTDLNVELLNKAIDNYLVAYRIFSKSPEHNDRVYFIKTDLKDIYQVREQNKSFTEWLDAEIAKPSAQ